MLEPKIQNITGAIEAILFVYGEPIEIKKIIKILNNDANLQIYFNQQISPEKFIKEILEQLNQQYQNENRGLKLIFSDSLSGQQVQIATKPEFASTIKNLAKEELKENLTATALETLSLVSYLGPLSRAQIDFYRGVNSSFILRALLIRGLIERFSDPKKTNVYLYKPSFDLLKYLGISNIEELPEYNKYKSDQALQAG